MNVVHHDAFLQIVEKWPKTLCRSLFELTPGLAKSAPGMVKDVRGSLAVVAPLPAGNTKDV
jgi:hypothetical protein